MGIGAIGSKLVEAYKKLTTPTPKEIERLGRKPDHRTNPDFVRGQAEAAMYGFPGSSSFNRR